ncbi:MAG: transporter substrate-binding domain-containing protein [Roseinatronobacter sp.]
MKKLTLGLMLAAFAAGNASAQDVIRMGSEGAYPPYNFINDATGQLDGFERELGDALCAQANLTCEWVINDWDTIIPNLVSGTYDTIMAGMSITEARKQVISFSDKYLMPDASTYITLAGTDPSVIESGVVAAQSNTVQSGHVATTGASLLEFPTPDETIAALRNGEADALLAAEDFLAPYVAESNGELVFAGEPVYLGDGIGIGMRQSDDALRATFNEAIAALRADGTIAALTTKWFGDAKAQID